MKPYQISFFKGHILNGKGGNNKWGPTIFNLEHYEKKKGVLQLAL